MTLPCLRILCLSVLASFEEHIQVFQEEVKTVEQRGEWKEVVVEEVKIQQEEEWGPPEITQPLREVEDDWFVQLDVTPREPSIIPSGIPGMPCSPSQSHQHKNTLLSLCFVC